MSDKDKELNDSKNGIGLKNCNDALHKLTRQAEQALRAQQNNQNAEAKPKETKK